MFGTIVNCLAIIAGSCAGIFFSRKVTSELSNVITTAAGVVTLVIGMQMAFEAVNIIYLALSLIVGGLVGSWMNIDGAILGFGRILENKFGRPALDADDGDSGGSSRFAYAFLNSSVLFCVGAMAIVGSFKAGTSGDYTILLTKSTLDGFMAIVFASTMGIGTAFSAVSILVYQGCLTLLSGFLNPWVSEQMISELTGIGGALVIMISVNLLGLRTIKTANYLPGMLCMILFVVLDPLFMQISTYFV